MKFTNEILSLVSLLLFCEKTNCLKILAMLPVPVKSHWFIGSSIAKTLADVGHDVTVVSPFAFENPPEHYRDINLAGLEWLMQGKNLSKISRPKMIYDLHVIGLKFSECVLSNPNVIKLMNDKNEKFDLVIVELFLSPLFIGFGQYFNAPVIGITTSRSSEWSLDVSGNSAPLSYVPFHLADSTGRMTFKQRLDNALLASVEKITFLIFYLSQKQAYEKYFPNAKSSYTEMINKGVSMVLLNTHLSVSSAVPYLPNTIEIGGLHVEKSIKPLPEDLKAFIESAKHGVIYLSLGSVISSSYIPFETQQLLMKTFSQLKQKVIWKTETFYGKTLPDNVLIQNWCPQNDILAHPNVKLFITHAGILSLIETVYHGKPIIGIPFFADQKANIAFAEEKGFGYRLNPNQLTFELLSKALNEVLYNQSYAENMKRFSYIYHDQPMTPQAKLIYWVEYVARHKGASHLKSAGQDLNFIQYHMIDVFGLIFIAALFVLSSSLFCLRLAFKNIYIKKIKTA